MSNTLLLKGATLIAAGALGLVGLGALGPVFSPGTATAEQQAPSWQGSVTPAPLSDQTTPSATDTTGDFTDRITEMMQDHMGITGDQAKEWAGSMEDMMRSVHGDQADEILQQCTENGGPEGMMRGWDGTSSGGMMGGWGGNSGGGMMGGSSGGMMGGWGTN
jgi:hypothetical protein